MRVFGTAFALMMFAGLSGPPLSAEPPQVLVDGVRIDRILEEPDLVTPVGCSVAPDGAVYVVESHTHFPPENYDGPKLDRLWRIADRDGDGRFESRDVVVDDSKYTMQVVADAGDGWLYVAARNQVFRVPLPGDDRRAGQPRAALVRLKTEADYPHNGMGGLAYGPDGWVYIGLGENFGESHELTGSDGRVLRGSGEGGSIVRCRPDGTGLERVATGFWNPFGIGFDPAGRMWVVGNDPDASPPCRLLQVVPGGDYGFQFRFGRAGTNPLQAWNGQLPGTLGFAAGTGEAPCAVVAHRGWLWVTSWGDNRIERYRLSSHGAGVSAVPEVVIQGGPLFRPTGLGLGPDGALYACDWVDRSYTLHKQGRLWRITCDDRVGMAELPDRSPDEHRAARLAAADPLWLSAAAARDAGSSRATADAAGDDLLGERLDALGDADPFIQTAARWGLCRTVPLNEFKWDILPSGRARAAGLLTLRWLDLVGSAQPDGSPTVSEQRRIAACRRALQDESPEVQLAGLRWIAERSDRTLADGIEQLLASDSLTPQVLRVALATQEWLSSGAVDRQVVGGQTAAAAFALNPQRAPANRALALSLLDPNHPSLTPEVLLSLAQQGGPLSAEAIRTLTLRTAGGAGIEALARLADDPALDEALRADAVMGLAMDAESQRPRLERLAADAAAPQVQQEAARVLARLTEKPHAAGRPELNDLGAWLTRVGEGGQPAAGWRVFFRAGAGQCATCHAYQGRGARVGPDLSTLAGQQPRSRILESILDPHREIGPLYVPWQIVTVDGRVLTGLKLHEPGIGDQLRFLASDGTTFDVELEEIDEQRMISKSIMPDGLWQGLSDDELRDLLALLSNTE